GRARALVAAHAGTRARRTRRIALLGAAHFAVAAHHRRVLIRGTAGAAAVAGLGGVALVRGWAAHGAGGTEGICRAAVGLAGAAFGDVTRAGGGPALPGLLLVGGTGRGIAGAALGQVAVARRGTADVVGRPEVVGRAAGLVARARFGDVARTG